MSNFLRYGDLLTFRYRGKFTTEPQNINEEPREIEIKRGFLCGTGHLDGRLFLQTVGEGYDYSKNIQHEDLFPHFTNQRDFIFVVTPKLSFEFHKDYQKTFKQYQKFMKRILFKKKLSKEKEDIKKNFETKLVKLKERVLKEKELNMQIVEHNNGKNFLNYGNEVQLMHKDSGYFLAAMIECSQTKKIGYSCQLSNWFSDKMVFKLFPKFKSRELGDLIQAKESLILMSTFNNCFLNFTESETLHSNDIKPSEIENDEYLFRRHKTVVDPTSRRYSIFLSQAKNSSWIVELHSKLRNMNNDLLYGDSLVRLQHTESKGNVGADIPLTGVDAEVYARTYKGEFEHEENSIDGLWEIEHLKMDKRGTDFSCELLKNSMNENYRLSQPFRLRHFLTGRYLTKNVVHGSHSAVLSPIESPKNPANYAVLRFEPLLKSVDYLKYGHSYYLMNGKYYLRYKNKHTLSSNLIIQQFTSRNQSSKFNPISEKEKEEKRVAMHFDKIYSTEDAYLVKNVGEEYFNDIFFVRSGVLKLNEVIWKFNRKEKPTNEDYSTVQTMLNKIVYFLYDEDYLLEEELIEFEEEPNQRKQFLFREYGFLEILTDLVFLGFSNKIYTYDELEANEFFLLSLRQSYNCIENIIQEYRPNELYSSQWLQPILTQSLITADKTEIRASSTLVELLDNNKKILENRVNNKVVKKFIEEIIDKEKNKKFLEILYVLCICNEKPIPKNQITLTELIVGHKKVMKHLNVELKKSKNMQIYDSGQDKWMKIEKLFKLRANKLHTKFANYFKKLIKFYSAVCFQRNLKAIKILQKYFEYETCYRILVNEEIHHTVRASFALLTRDLWVDINPFYPIETPNNIVLWDELKEDVAFPRTIESVKKYETLMSYILKYLKELKVADIINTRGKDLFIQNILKLTLCFVNLGFFKFDDITDLIESLKILLFKKLSELNRNSGELGTSSKSTIAEIEKVIIKIFVRLLSFQLDMRTRLFCYEFKIVYQQAPKTDEENDSLEDPIDETIRLKGKRNQVVPYESENRVFKFSDEEIKQFEKDDLDENQIKKNQEFDEKVYKIIDKKLKHNDWIKFDRHDDYKSLLGMITTVDDFSLKTEMLNLLNQMHSQLSLLKQSLSSIQFITSDRKKSYHHAKKLTLSFQNYSLNISKFYKEENSSNIFKDLDDLIQSILPKKFHIELERDVLGDHEKREMTEENSFSEDTEDEDENIGIGMNEVLRTVILHKTSKSNIFMQDLMRNTHLYSHLINILKYDLEIAKRNSSRNIPLVKKIYLVLALACKANPVNKKYFAEKLRDTMVVHLSEEYNFNVEIFINHMVIDNKSLLIGFENVKLVARKIISKIQKLENCNVNKSLLISTLGAFTKYKNMVLKTNQDNIMNEIFYHSHARNITENYSTAYFLKKIEDEVSNIHKYFDNSRGRNVILFSNEMYYLTELFDLLTKCGEGKNLMTENISQKILSIGQIDTMLRIKNANFLYKTSILGFLFDIYLDIEKEIPLTLQIALIPTLKFLAEELQNIFKLLESKDSLFMDIGDNNLKIVNTDVLTISDYYSAEKIIFKYAGVIGECFSILIPKFESRTGKAADEFNSIMTQVVSLSIHFGSIHDLEIRRKLDQLMFYGKKFDDYGPMTPGARSPGKRFSRSRQTHLSNFNIRAGRTLEDYSNINNRLNIHDGHGITSDIAREIYKVYKNINRILNCQEYESKIEREFEEWIQIIHEIERNDEQIKKYELFIHFLKSLVEYFDNKDNDVDEILALSGLKIFRKFIENSVENEDNFLNSENNLTCDSWNSEIWDRYRGKIVRRQNLLLETGVVNWICDLFKDKRSSNLNDSAMMLSIALLVGGNKNVQMEFHKKIVEDIDNKILVNLSEYINESFDIISRNMNEKNEARLKMIINESLKKKKKGYKSRLSTIVLRNEVKNIEFEFVICTRTYRFLQLLCEGHNEALQNSLREQRSFRKGGKISVQFKEINFISFTTQLFGKFIKIFNPSCSDLGVQILDFIVEVVQGPCLQNQLMVFDSKVVDFCKDFLNDLHLQAQIFEEMFKEDKDKLNDFVKKVIILLNSIIEGNYNKKIINFMAENLDINFLLILLQKEYTNFIESNQKSKSESDRSVINRMRAKKVWSEDIVEAFSIFFLINVIDEITGKYYNRLSKMDKEMQIAYDFFAENSAHIEIMFKGNIEKYYFVVQPACRFLDEGTKELLMDNVNRDTPTEKITDFINRVPFLFDTMDHKANLRSRTIKVNPNLFKIMRFLALMVTFAISFIMAFYFGKRYENSVGFTRRDFDENKAVFYYLAVSHVVLSSMMNMVWLLIEAPMANMDGWRKAFLKIKRKLTIEKESLEGTEMDYDVDNILHILLRNVASIKRSERIEILKFVNQREGRHTALHCIEYYTKSFLFIIRNSTFRFLNFYLITSILAMYYQTEGFLIAYSILMLDVVAWFEVMRSVIYAITNNLNQLSLTFALGCVIMYNYALFAYEFFDDTFFNSSVGNNNGENLCVDVIQCFSTVFSLGPRSSGGIGDVVIRQSYKDTNTATFYLRYFYDLTCFILVNLIWLNILFGIIIDAFADKRDKREVIEENKKDVCFVCSLHRDAFGKNTKTSFEKHRENEHNIWNYLNFMYYLMKKDSTEFTGLESYVYEQYIKDSVSWIPLLKCRAIKEDGADEDLEEGLDRLLNGLESLYTVLTSSG